MPRPLYLVLSGAPAPEEVTELARALHSHGWHVIMLSTPAGTDFHDQDQLADLTVEPVRVAFRMPGLGKPLPPADVVLACLLTFNSTNKFAQGLADNFAIALLCEMVGYGVPTGWCRTANPSSAPTRPSHATVNASTRRSAGWHS